MQIIQPDKHRKNYHKQHKKSKKQSQLTAIPLKLAEKLAINNFSGKYKLLNKNLLPNEFREKIPTTKSKTESRYYFKNQKLKPKNIQNQLNYINSLKYQP